MWINHTEASRSRGDATLMDEPPEQDVARAQSAAANRAGAWAAQTAWKDKASAATFAAYNRAVSEYNQDLEGGVSEAQAAEVAYWSEVLHREVDEYDAGYAAYSRVVGEYHAELDELVPDALKEEISYWRGALADASVGEDSISVWQAQDRLAAARKDLDEARTAVAVAHGIAPPALPEGPDRLREWLGRARDDLDDAQSVDRDAEQAGGSDDRHDEDSNCRSAEDSTGGDDMTPRYRPEPLWWAPASDPADPDSNGETLLPGETIPEARVRLGCYDPSASALVTGTKKMIAEQDLKAAEWRQSMGLGSEDKVAQAREALAGRKQEASAAAEREYGRGPQMGCCVEVFPGETTAEAIARARAAVAEREPRRADDDRADDTDERADDDSYCR